MTARLRQGFAGRAGRVAALAAAALIAGCGPDIIYEPPPPPTPAGLLTQSYRAADALLGNLTVPLSPARPLLVASIADIDALDRSSTLGRAIAEQVASRLAQRGRRVAELRLRGTVLVREGEGEFVLSRSAAEVARVHEAEAVVSGTYARGAEALYVSLRLVRLADGVLVAAHDFRLALDTELLAMLSAHHRFHADWRALNVP